MKAHWSAKPRPTDLPVEIDGERCMTIGITGGLSAIVDSEDYKRISEHRWIAIIHKGKTYARRSIRIGGSVTTITMHREVLGLPIGDGTIVDHKNGNSLDNRKSNIRIATSSQNMANSKSDRKNNSSGFKGVIRIKGSSKWAARVRFKGKYKQVCGFDSPELAARAYDQMAKEFHGEFACLNFKEEKRNAQ